MVVETLKKECNDAITATLSFLKEFKETVDNMELNTPTDSDRISSLAEDLDRAISPLYSCYEDLNNLATDIESDELEVEDEGEDEEMEDEEK